MFFFFILDYQEDEKSQITKFHVDRHCVELFHVDRHYVELFHVDRHYIELFHVDRHYVLLGNLSSLVICCHSVFVLQVQPGGYHVIYITEITINWSLQGKVNTGWKYFITGRGRCIIIIITYNNHHHHTLSSLILTMPYYSDQI